MLTHAAHQAGNARLSIYIAGPMTGLPDYNHPAFRAEALVWRDRGFEVQNPADGPELPNWPAYMRRALRQMLTCEAICLLPGWTHSKGATVEWLLACILGMSIVYHEPPGRLQRVAMRLLEHWVPGQAGKGVRA